MTNAEKKREFGREAEEVFREVKKELRNWLDATHKDSEKIPEPDLWSDFAMGLKYWAHTLEMFSERLEITASNAYQQADEEVQRTLPR
tara:strand:- start:2386 stop:2649 length:264 start_codon:yes stop_codon:yes gene_type:complete